MAEVHVMPGAAPPVAAVVAPVQGWAYDGGPGPAPVIINPDASTQALAAWALSQLQQVNTLALLIGCSRPEIDLPAADVVNAFRHFTEQAQCALEECNRRTDEATAG
jgi:hypothetical protein